MKIGCIQDDHEIEQVYLNIFEEILYKNGTRCLRITSAESLSNLMVELGKFVHENWYILYVLLISHSGNKPGRYQGVEIECYDGVKALFDKYQAFFDGDGRHNVWLGSTKSNDLLVYDKHNIIYAYGPIDKYKEFLVTNGYCNGTIKIPVPHTHHYPSENVKFESSILNEWDWKWFKLCESDDE